MLPDLVRGSCCSTSVLLGMEKVTLIPGDKVPGWWPTLPATGPSCPAVERQGWKRWCIWRNQLLFPPEKSLGRLGVPCTPLSPRDITRGGSSHLLSHPRVGLMKWSRESSPLHT